MKEVNFYNGLPLDIQIRLLDDRYKNEDWPLPQYETEGSAALDLRAAITEPIAMVPGSTHLIPTGLSLYIASPGWVGLVFPRSGLGHNHGIVLGNGTGVIDSDYQGTLSISLTNRKTSLGPFDVINALIDDPVIIEPGDRIAQIMFVPVARASLKVVDLFANESTRGEGGFGSTGVRDA